MIYTIYTNGISMIIDHPWEIQLGCSATALSARRMSFPVKSPCPGHGCPAKTSKSLGFTENSQNWLAVTRPGKLTKNPGKSWCFMGKSPCYQWLNINYFDWAMFNSEVLNYQRVLMGKYMELSWETHAGAPTSTEGPIEITDKTTKTSSNIFQPLNLICLISTLDC